MSADAPTPSPSVFTRVISGEFPGRFVWRDPDVVAFLSIAPIRPGHTLVVPVRQIDHWTDLDESLWARMATVQLAIGQALKAAFEPERVGSIIAGMEVPHCHVHLIPIRDEGDLSFARADASPDPDRMDADAERIRVALRDMGRDEVADA
jgi:diadenosine tetraphosphate (Ap4A) HIT family hydrolase